MRPLLSQAEVLASLAHSPSLLAFDFDGTLAPIVRTPRHARLTARTGELFRELCELFPCAVISGRARADVRSKVVGMPVRFVVGNHGIEPSRTRTRARLSTRRAKAWIAPIAALWEGVELEDKRYSLSLHYRKAKRKDAARRALLRALAAPPIPLRVIRGKQVLNVLPASTPDKGQALRRLRTVARAKQALYVGDDVTDEDVFARDDIPGLVTVRVGRARRSAARYYLRNQREIDALMSALIALRRKEGPRR